MISRKNALLSLFPLIIPTFIQLTLAASAAAQTPDTVRVLFRVEPADGLSNVRVVASPGGGSASTCREAQLLNVVPKPGGTSARDTIYLISTSGTTGVLPGAARRHSVPARIIQSRGNVSLTLDAAQYRDAVVSLYGVNGKRVMHGKASAASSGTFALSRQNLAPGAYMLSARGTNGNSYSAKVVHNGGRLNINTAFSGADLSIRELAAVSDCGPWTLTLTANGFQEKTVDINLSNLNIGAIVMEPIAPRLTVSFNLGYGVTGTPPAPISVSKGSGAGNLLPANPTRATGVDGVVWTFAGWYENATVYDRNTPIEKEMTLTAKWSFQNTGNPLIRHVFTADPAPMVYNNTVYLYTSHDEHFRNEGYFTMYDWLCFSSTDMQTWVEHGPILHRDAFSWNVKPTNPDNADAWAAQMVERDGKFYFYVTQTRPGGRAIGVAVGDSPVGPFVDARGTPLINGNEPVNGRPASQLDAGWGKDIDPTVWIDNTGQAYMAWGNPQRDWCLLVKLKSNMIEIDGGVTTIPLPNFTEGPWLYQRNGYWYNVYASHAHQGQSERISYAMADDIYGTWVHKGEVTGNAGSYTIHPGIIDFKGASYLFYHNHSLNLTVNGTLWRGTTGRRAVTVDYMYYNADGTIKPVVQTRQGVTVPPAN